MSLPAPINWLLTSAKIERLELENQMLKKAMGAAVGATEQGLENILGDVEQMRQAAEGQLEAYRQGIRLIIESIETIISAAANVELMDDIQVVPTAPLQVMVDTVRESPLMQD